MTRDAIVVATFNVHAGINGWGVPYDVVRTCLELDADVLALEECWTGADAGESIAHRIATAGGYTVLEATLGRARRVAPPGQDAPPHRRWGPPLGRELLRPIWLLDPARKGSSPAANGASRPTSTPGEWGIALLARPPVVTSEIVELPQLRGDRARRKAIVADLDIDGRGLRVIATHLGHLLKGSPRQMRAIDRIGSAEGKPTVVLGDFNCWGPPLRVLIPHFNDVVRGPTWPAWRPHSRIDHVLVSDKAMAGGGEVVGFSGSDHRPVRSRINVLA